MRPDALPARAEELVKQFVGSTERLLFYLDAIDGPEASSWLTILCSPTPEDVEQNLLQAVRTRHFQVLNPILASQQLQWTAIAQALDVSCSSDAVDVTAVLLPRYKAFRASDSAWSSHHRRLLCSALGTRHLPTLQLLLECEPRGEIRRLPELIAVLQAEEAPSASLVAILAGQEADELNDPVLWDPETLLRAISHGDLEFVQFLMAYVKLPQDALTAALEAAKATESHEVVRAIATRLQTAGDLEVSASRAFTVSGSSEALHFIASNAVDGFVSAAMKRLVASVEVEATQHDLEAAPDPPEAEKEGLTDPERLENASMAEQVEESQESQPPALNPAEPVVAPVDPLVLTALLPQEASKFESKARGLPPQPAKTSATRPTHAIIPCQVNWTLSTANASALAVTSASQLHEGDRVEARYKGRAVFFPGVVAVCHAGGASYDVVYDDGEEEKGVEREYLRLLPPEPGQYVGDQASKRDEEDVETAIPTENDSSTASIRSLSSAETYPQEGDDWGESLEALEAKSELETAREDSLEAPIQSSDATATLSDPCQLRDLEFTSAPGLETQIPRVQTAPLVRSKSLGLTPESPMPQLPSEGLEVADLPEIPTILVFTPASVRTEKELSGDIRPPSHTTPSQTRGISPPNSTISPLELAEWRNVDLLLSRKRRLLQAQTGSVESTKVPWGEQFATIQSLKRFAIQHPLVLREYMWVETQLQDLDGPLTSPSSPGKPQSPRPTRSSVHSGAAQARDSLLLVKDLAFLLRHRLAPFFDVILPVVLLTVFHTEKRFLCETATEVLEAIVLHCSGRKLALRLLQLGEGYSKHEDLRRLNLTSIYVDKCVGNWSKAEMAGLRTSRSTPELMILLAALLGSKSAPARISAQKSVARLREELGVSFAALSDSILAALPIVNSVGYSFPLPRPTVWSSCFEFMSRRTFKTKCFNLAESPEGYTYPGRLRGVTHGDRSSGLRRQLESPKAPRSQDS
ncbi:hypothetical protein BBJ28_00018867 [Nothophytophthora sp. Chile5]|nr:hypothetical protein BBJ28_00018867 [Nothophytophthora sp. Chile5]